MTENVVGFVKNAQPMLAPKINQATEMRTTKFELSFDTLKGRQSVRATFTLPKEAIELLGVIAAQLGIKQKSLFDHLIEDIGALGEMAVEAHGGTTSARERQQKTFVISRSSLVTLDAMAQQQRVPRDLLVEFSIKRLLPVLAAERKRHEQRKVLLGLAQEYLEQGRIFLRQAGELLGEEDELYTLLADQVTLSARNCAAINNIVERGKAMEEW